MSKRLDRVFYHYFMQQDSILSCNVQIFCRKSKNQRLCMRKFVGFAADDIEKFEWLPSGSLKAQIDEKKFSKLYLPQSIFADFFAHKFKESNVMYICFSLSRENDALIVVFKFKTQKFSISIFIKS